MLAEVVLGSAKLVLDGGMGGTVAGAVAAELSMAITSSARIFDGQATITAPIVSFERFLVGQKSAHDGYRGINSVIMQVQQTDMD